VNDFHSIRADVETSIEGTDLAGQNPSRIDSLVKEEGVGHDNTPSYPEKTTHQVPVDVPCTQPGKIDDALAATGLWEAKQGSVTTILEA
jgi:hypothetical protein